MAKLKTTGGIKITTLISSAIILTTSAFLFSVVSTASVRKIALKAGFVSQPSADRFSNKIVPLGGGIAIFATLFVFILTAAMLIKFLPTRFDSLAQAANINLADFSAKINQLIIVLLAITALFILGLLDDKKNLGAIAKLATQMAVAIAAAGLGEIRVEFFIESKIITTLISAVWLVVIMNAFNLLDNMDGAAAGIAVIVSSILFTAAAFSGQIFVGGLALVFIGAVLGFLIFNFPPAKIFMGDAGSLVIGFIIGMLTLRTTYYHELNSGKWYPVLLPLIALAVPLYDLGTVLLLRISQGKNPFKGDTQHFSHRLKTHGLTDTQTVLTLYLATLTTGLSATFLYQVNLTGAILIFAQTIMVLAIIAVFEAANKNDKTNI
ncbi:MAG: undecaprenyl/decaprenyl-phosphate alpha-N-acetylglucosaminyl 1-phosphate transferase [Planctomycetes bacterium]|nr:undecaprenyl/decaprenyl-phosphate alpha-N-acetylglucosaminyl 1-phosphate transferase [Planctomycetota bacterium]